MTPEEQYRLERDSYFYGELRIEGMKDSIWSNMFFSVGVHELSIEDVRDRLGAATTTDEIADILVTSLSALLDKTAASPGTLKEFAASVRDVEDIDEFLTLTAECGYIKAERVPTGAAYLMTYDFPSRTGTYSEAVLHGEEITYRGCPFVNEDGDEYNPFD